MNRVLVVLTGFVFWMVATHLYSDNDVGLAVAFVSSSQLIGSFALFGFDTSIIRFFKSYDRSNIFNTSFILVTVFSIILGVVFIAGVKYFSPDLSILQQPAYAAIFLLFTMALSVAAVTAQAFIAMRDAKYSFIQNVLLTLRIPLLLPMLFLGSLGILSATFIAYLVAYLIVFYFLARFISFRPEIDIGFLRLSYKFSFANYISNMLYSTTFSIIPIMVLNVAGSASSAMYYMGYTVGAFTMQIPLALSISLFVEGIYGESLRKSVKKIGVLTIGALLATIVFFNFFGRLVLSLFGKNYVGAFDLLMLISVSSVLYAVYVIFTILLNMKMRVNYIIVLNVFLFILVDALSYFFLTRYGITGIGYAFIIAYGILDIFILYLAKKWEWL
jgi:O-antigen/teichoic acid export membrane protein